MIKRIKMNYLELAMNETNFLGVDYADIRIQKTHSKMTYLRNLSLKKLRIM
jgi:TldD protein